MRALLEICFGDVRMGLILVVCYNGLGYVNPAETGLVGSAGSSLQAFSGYCFYQHVLQESSGNVSLCWLLFYTQFCSGLSPEHSSAEACDLFGELGRLPPASAALHFRTQRTAMKIKCFFCFQLCTASLQFHVYIF